MKTENILKYALDLRAALDPNNEHSRSEDLETLKAVNAMIPNDPHTLTALIIAECKAEEPAPAPAKKARKSKAQKAAEKLLKRSKGNYPGRSEWHYAQMREGAQYITDGATVVKLIAPLPLEEGPADVPCAIDVSKKWDDLVRDCTISLGYLDTADLEEYISERKTEKIITYVFNGDLGVNARYLLDALEILNAKSVHAFANAKNDRLYIQAENGEALVFGRRRTNTEGTTPAQ